ncbi:JAB domain-containing protein [Nitrosospira sp. Nsp1]|uniref:JAB domain-containing protein n=1 Tax=Nitrosospira sp. Nsp1 TaxID=136547 RepID=UPI00087EF6FE|nr:JAB domain-containing protein [Nitrosospira sp. Nsp1]SCX56877.1 DNA repair protein RadC [Nitrosospira sp. Nsp1]
MIAVESMFTGTLTQTSVYPREVLKRCLHYNAASVLFCHNHPSGIAKPSQADEVLTKNLKDVLGLVDVRVLDHIVICHAPTWKPYWPV